MVSTAQLQQLRPQPNGTQYIHLILMRWSLAPHQLDCFLSSPSQSLSFFATVRMSFVKRRFGETAEWKCVLIGLIEHPVPGLSRRGIPFNQQDKVRNIKWKVKRQQEESEFISWNWPALSGLAIRVCMVMLAKYERKALTTAVLIGNAHCGRKDMRIYQWMWRRRQRKIQEKIALLFNWHQKELYVHFPTDWLPQSALYINDKEATWTHSVKSKLSGEGV